MVKGDDMNRSTFIVVALVAVWFAAGGAVAGHDSVTGKCIKVIDGDTLVVKCDSSERTVNVAGIDAPELDQPWGKQIRSFVRDMVRGHQVELDVLESSGDQVTARVMVDGTELAELLVGRGLAWVQQSNDDGELNELATKAREMPCGLWTDPAPVPPWEYRAVSS